MNETLPHAVQRMRSQGYKDNQIAAQIHQWHAGWTPAQVLAVMAPQAHVTKAKESYRPAGMPSWVHWDTPGPAFTTALGAPAKGVSEQQSQEHLARIYQQNHPIGQQVLEGLANATPGVALAKGIRDSHVGLGTVGAEAVNDVTSGLVPAGKAAALFGGLRGLRRARASVTAIEDVGKVAKVAETAKVAGPAKVAGREPTLEEARARLAELEAQHTKALDKMAKSEGPVGKVESEATSNQRQKFKKQQSGKDKNGRNSGAAGTDKVNFTKTQTELRRDRMESKVEAFIAKHPDDPVAKAWRKRTNEMDALVKALSPDIFEPHDLSGLPRIMDAPAAVKSEASPLAPASDFFNGTPEPPPAGSQGTLFAADPFEAPVKSAPTGRATQMPADAEQIRAALSGRAAREALKRMGEYEKIGAKIDNAADPTWGMSAKRAYKAEAELRTEERIARFREGHKVLADKTLDPSERIRLWKKEMAGELPKIHWGGFDSLDGDMVKAMSRYAMDQAPGLLDTQRVKVVMALENAVNGTAPRPHELKLLEHVFGKDAATGFAKLATDPVRETIVGVLNIPRALMASMDFSAPLRQGLVIGTRHPRIAGQNFLTMFKSFASEKTFQALGDEIKSRPTYPLMLEAKLPLTGLDRGISNAEEAFIGESMAEKITGGKKYSPVRWSDRAYTGFLDKTRADVFDVLIRQAQSQGVNVQDEKFLKDLGRFIGNASGRGTFDHQALEQAMPLLNVLLFSPRLVASRLQLINPAYYVRLDPFVRREALTAALSTFGAIGTVLGLAAWGGAKVGIDPRSSDFGKIKLGITRIDIAGGFNQYFHLLGELVTGQRINTTTGELSSLHHPKFGQQSTWDVLVNFGRGKESPIPSMITDYLTGKSGISQPFSLKAEAQGHFLPLIWQDAHDLYKHPFHGMNGIEAALAGYGVEMFGTGLQTYEQAPSKGTGTTGDPFESPSGGGSDPFEHGPGQ